MSEAGDPRLEEVIRGLEATSWAAEVCDADWRLVWVSSQIRALIGQEDDSGLGLGKHVLESRQLPAWERMVSPEAQEQWLRLNVPQMLADDPGGAERIADLARPDARQVVLDAEPAEIPIWTWLTTTTGVMPAINEVRNFGMRVRTSDGKPFATVYIYGANLPATLLALVAQGDQGMFERMARLTEPGRREVAVLFADIQSSGELSRHLSSAAYFRLVQALFTELDGVVIDADGIVGKHAGDGLSAFFLAEQCGGREAAAGAAIDAAVKLATTARETGAQSELEPAHELRLNVGVHWGGALYMGQVVTGGRLEVTALGDEVNECARIQETAREGTVLASKALIERLDLEHAREIGIDPDAVAYETIGEMPGASEKAVRDAGSIPVTEVPCERS
ncbi:MAG: adenylate cyclase [Thermoleophilaceae bacterium]|nr:adenylate cyclase [Thermoleophilaceae bacterium]MEA2436237.1 adenylate cyclase [Thermoleophilaceae bacterium]